MHWPPLVPAGDRAHSVHSPHPLTPCSIAPPPHWPYLSEVDDFLVVISLVNEVFLVAHKEDRHSVVQLPGKIVLQLPYPEVHVRPRVILRRSEWGRWTCDGGRK